jgi:predicted PurR-regulated permease PerM
MDDIAPGRLSPQEGPPADVSRPQRARIRPAELPGVGSLLTLAVCVVVVAALYLAREVLIPVTLAVLLSFLLAPLASLLRRLHIPRTPSVLLAVILALGLILGTGAVIGMQIAELSADLPDYQATLSVKIETLQASTLGRLEVLMKQLSNQFARSAETAPAAPPPVTTGRRHAPVPLQGTVSNPLTVQVLSPSPSAFDVVERLAGPVVGPLGTVALVLIVAVFILLQQEDLRDRLIRLFGSSDLHRTTLAMNDAARRLSKYFLTQLAINAVFGLVTGTGLFFIGVPSPVLWGIVGLLLRFVPYVGAVLAGFIPFLLGASVDPTWHTALRVLALYCIVEPVMGQVVEPVAYGHSTGLSPISVVIAAIFWTWIWGPIGLLLATPLTLILVVLGRHVKRLEFLDVLLGDRPALTPVESLYQRMLAGDPDSAASQAELLLRERPLSAYYDEVALRALQLAASDVARGVLARDQQLLMRDAILGLVEDLDEHDDLAPSPRQRDDGPAAPPEAERIIPRTAPIERPAPPAEALAAVWPGAAILCLGGRGPLDDAAASMLCQLLNKHGLPARMSGHDSVSRAGLASLDLTEVTLVVVSYMEATGSPAHLRVLLRRLRARLPEAALVLGLWASELEPEPDRDVRGVTGADATAGTLRESLALCIEAAWRATASERPADRRATAS